MILNHIKNHIKRVFTGKEELWKVFWFWNILPNTIIIYTTCNIKRTAYYPQANTIFKQILDTYFLDLPMSGVFISLIASTVLVLFNSYNTKNHSFRKIVMSVGLFTVLITSALFLFLLIWVYAWRKNQGI